MLESIVQTGPVKSISHNRKTVVELTFSKNFGEDTVYKLICSSLEEYYGSLNKGSDTYKVVPDHKHSQPREWSFSLKKEVVLPKRPTRRNGFANSKLAYVSTGYVNVRCLDDTFQIKFNMGNRDNLNGKFRKRRSKSLSYQDATGFYEFLKAKILGNPRIVGEDEPHAGYLLKFGIALSVDPTPTTTKMQTVLYF